jgi:hypothetical protein
VTVIEPHLVPSSRPLSHGRRAQLDYDGLTSTNWTGVSVRAPGVKYQWVFGSWPVPTTTSEGGFWSTTYVGNWVGLDGEVNSIDVVQAGTTEATSTRFWVASSSDWAWVEWYPATSNVIPNFPVNPGDQIDTWVWMTDANGNYNVNGGFGSFMLYNATQYILSNVARIPAPPGVTFMGTSAEWITERPGRNYNWYDLTEFSPYTMTQAYARDSNGQMHNFTTDFQSSDIFWLVDPSNNLMAGCWEDRPETMSFYWYGFN